MSAINVTEVHALFGITASNLPKGINCVLQRSTACSVKLSMNCMKDVVLSGVKVDCCAFRGPNDNEIIFALSNMCKEEM